jgi:cardiolipin synthase
MPLKFSQIWTAPNEITLLRLIFIPFVIMNVMGGDYRWAITLFLLAGASDALDGSLARLLKQKTVLGQYLDPIADKLLLSSCFLVLSFEHKIAWKFTVLVLSRDICIVAISGALYATNALRDFRPSLYGKLNTAAQVLTIPIVMAREIYTQSWLVEAKAIALWTTFALTLVSGVHYILVTGQRLRDAQARGPSAAS